jgi:protein tyrosine/serine phosphatase
MFHCAVGADRAGTVAFLLHGLLGMSMEDCIRDYELTTLSTIGVRTHTSAEFQGLLKALREFGDPPDDLAGQAEGYLRSIGVTADEIGAIRRLLIEDVPDNRSGARARDLRARPFAWENLVMCRMGG